MKNVCPATVQQAANFLSEILTEATVESTSTVEHIIHDPSCHRHRDIGLGRSACRNTRQECQECGRVARGSNCKMRRGSHPMAVSPQRPESSAFADCSALRNAIARHPTKIAHAAKAPL